MLLPPATALAPWQPGLWITQTGYALTPADVAAGTKQGSKRRAELHQAQEKLIRQQNISERLIAESQRQAAASRKKRETLISNHRSSVSYSEKLIKALRERMSEEMFLSTAAYVRALEDSKP